MSKCTTYAIEVELIVCKADIMRDPVSPRIPAGALLTNPARRERDNGLSSCQVCDVGLSWRQGRAQAPFGRAARRTHRAQRPALRHNHRRARPSPDAPLRGRLRAPQAGLPARTGSSLSFSCRLRSSHLSSFQGVALLPNDNTASILIG